MSILDGFLVKPAERNFKLVLVGQGGAGKSSIASFAPDPLFLQTNEERTDYLDGIKKLPKCTELGTPPKMKQDFEPVNPNKMTLYEQLRLIIDSEKGEFKTLVFDSTSGIQSMIKNSVYAECKDEVEKKDLEGYSGTKLIAQCDLKFEELLRWVDFIKKKKGVNIIFCVHEKIVKYKPPVGDEYEVFRMALYDRKDASLSRQLSHWADFVFRLAIEGTTTTEVKGSGKHQRKITRAVADMPVEYMLYTEAQASFYAKNAKANEIDESYELDLEGEVAKEIYAKMK